MATRIINPAPPNLPLGTDQYDRRYQDSYSNVLRLYFNQLKNALSELFGDQGGRFINFPYGAFHQNGSTTLSANITNVSTTPISVASTSGFPSSGWILIGNEIISYTVKTATTFDGTITRGVFGTTNVAHTAGAAITEVQGTGSPTTIGKVLFNNTDYSNGVATNPSDQTQLVFSNSGVYNLQLSAQLLNFTTSEDNVTIWIRKNGVDVAATAGIVEVAPKHGTSPGAYIASWNYFLDLLATDYVQLVWTSDTGNTVLGSFPAGTAPVHPVSPGIIFTCQFVSALPA